MRHVIILIISFLLISCHSTKYVEVPVETIKTEYVNHIHFDSIYVHDSIDRYTANDTVFLTKYKYINKLTLKVDTVLKIDTIQLPIYIDKIETKEVNKLTIFQKIFMYLGIGTFGGILCILIGYLKKFIKWKI